MKKQKMSLLADIGGSYDPANHYWIVAGDESQVYSSVAGDFVPVNNAAYVAWLAAGSAPTRIASNAELGEVLAPLSLRPFHADVLDGYKDAQAVKLTIETVAKVAFNHENRIRALENRQTVSPSQFKQALKDLM